MRQSLTTALALTAALLLQLAAVPAHAIDLDDAFGNLLKTQNAATAITSPGEYQSQARNTFVAGGLDVRIPQSQSANLISLTPPSFNAGCNGISLQFGGLSFISGPQIEQMISNIAQNATGYVVSIVIKTLCPMCSSVIETMQNLAQQAAKASIDSCQVAHSLVSKFFGDPSKAGADGGSGAKSMCAMQSMGSGETSDWQTAWSDTCSSVGKAIDEVTSWLNGLDDKNGEKSTAKDHAAAKLVYGNTMWRALKTIMPGTDQETINRRLLLMSLTGTTIIKKRGDDQDPAAYHQPLLTPAQDYDLFMCGDPTKEPTDPVAGGYCQSFRASMKGAAVYFCQDTDDCMNMTTEPVNKVITGEGFVQHVHEILTEAVKAVVEDQKIPDKAIELIQGVPLPIYQAINAASVYPAAAGSLIQAMSVMTAEMLAEHYLANYVRAVGNSAKQTTLPRKMVMRVVAAAEKVTGMATARMQAIAQRMSIQESLAGQIQQINRAVQLQVLTTDLLNANGFAQQLNTDTRGQTSHVSPPQRQGASNQ
jgi:hypothetical protein